MKPYDIIVAGGGISGSMAAIAAARFGAQVLVIEKYGFLGGMLTNAGVGPMMTFHAGETQVVQGITGELIERLKARGKSPGHIFDTTGYTYTVTPFDVEGMKHELEEMLMESGGDVLYHTMLAAVQTQDRQVQSLTICNKAGLSELQADYYVDATGDGDLSAWAGVDFSSGRDADGLNQPMTMNLRMRNVDIAKVKQYIKAHPEEFPRLKGDTGIVDRAERLSIGGFVLTLRDAQAKGDISFKRDDVLFFETNSPGEVIINTSRVINKLSTDPWSLSSAETEGRQQARELETFLNTRIAGFEHAELVYSGPQIGVRSSRRIKGLYTLTVDDLLAGRMFNDAIAYTGYPIDVHAPEGQRTSKDKPLHQVDDKFHDKQGHVASIPYRCLVNGQIDNLITVGRCISSSFDANGAIRTTPIVGAIGHAGGVAVALAAKQGLPLSALHIQDIHEVLRAQKAYLALA